MSLLVAVSTLTERVRCDCNLPVYTTVTNVSSAQALEYIQRSAQQLAALIQESGADEQYLTLSTQLTTTAGIPTVSLPANTMDVVRLAIVTSGTHEVQMEVASLDEWDPNNYVWDTNAIPKYRVMGNTVTLFPTQGTARTINAYYTVGFTVTSTSDILALRNNWDEYIVADSCIRVRNRQDKDSTAFEKARGIAEQAIRKQLKRDRAGIRQVRDVRDPWLLGGPYSRQRWFTR